MEGRHVTRTRASQGTKPTNGSDRPRTAAGICQRRLGAWPFSHPVLSRVCWLVGSHPVACLRDAAGEGTRGRLEAWIADHLGVLEPPDDRGGQGPGIHEFATEALTVPNPLDGFRVLENMVLDQAGPQPTSQPSFPVFLQA